MLGISLFIFVSVWVSMFIGCYRHYKKEKKRNKNDEIVIEDVSSDNNINSL